MGSQCNCASIIKDPSGQGNFQGLDPRNVHLILESEKQHCRGSGDEIVDLYCDAVKVIGAGLGFCQYLMQEKIFKTNISCLGIKTVAFLYAVVFF